VLGGGPGGHTPWWHGLGVARATTRSGRPLVRLLLSFGLRLRVRYLETSAFVSSNSENISYVTFLKHKTEENRELALWHLVNRLVPENA
jgi:hypothetical protein